MGWRRTVGMEKDRLYRRRRTSGTKKHCWDGEQLLGRRKTVGTRRRTVGTEKDWMGLKGAIRTEKDYLDGELLAGIEMNH